MTIHSKHIAVTGSSGFLGWHLRCYARSLGFQFIEIPDDAFRSTAALAKLLDSSDVVIHLAGMNRGTESEVYSTNLELTHKLIASLELLNNAPTVIFANSIHSLGGSYFGRSKKDTSILLAAWADAHNSRYVDLILPHLFGEGGRPFYNSAFATFCYQLTRGEVPQVNHAGEVELVHAQLVARQIWEFAFDGTTQGLIRLEGHRMPISETLGRLRTIHEKYMDGIIPSFASALDLDFFNTYRSYLFPEHCPVYLAGRKDSRGVLFEAVKSLHGGQAFLSTTHSGVTRGRHYHHRKLERFLVVSGEAEIRIRRLFDDEVYVFQVRGSEPCYIDIPTFHTHEISNVGSNDLLTLFWSNEIFDPFNSDTYPEVVVQ